MFSGLTGPAVQAHIHVGKPGVSGNVLVPLCEPCVSGKTTTYRVHTAKNPAGEIRGQIKVTG